jgi:hypothetical protein
LFFSAIDSWLIDITEWSFFSSNYYPIMRVVTVVELLLLLIFSNFLLLTESFAVWRHLKSTRGLCLLAKTPRFAAAEVSTSLEVDHKLEALAGVMSIIEKNYGKGSIQKLGEAHSMNIATTSSGSMTMDIILGGGYPRGRVIEIFGPESSGKTTLALHAIAEVQRNGGDKCSMFSFHCLFIGWWIDWVLCKWILKQVRPPLLTPNMP